jgi:hypothetical protein
MERKPELSELIMHSGVKGMKWDEAKKKHNQDLAALNAQASKAWNATKGAVDHLTGNDLPKDQVGNDKFGARMALNMHMSSQAVKKIGDVLSKYADKTLTSIFGRSENGKITSKALSVSINGQAIDMKAHRVVDHPLSKAQQKKNKEAWKNAKNATLKDKFNY